MTATKQDWFPSKWGPDDETGALNETTPGLIAGAARLVKKGKIFHLSHVLESGIPQHWFHGEFQYSTFRRHSDTLKVFGSKNKLSAMNVKINMADHSGTHIDALNHTSIDGVLYNGVPAAEVTGTFGTTKLGIETTPPIFVRGVLLDVARAKRKAVLDPGYVITPSDIESCIKKEGVRLQRGDAVLIRTGWSKYWMRNNRKYLGHCPGIGKEAARLLIRKHVVLVGADAWNPEVDPNEDPAEEDIVHQMLLVKNGIRAVENLDLEGLAKERAWLSLFVCLPLRIKGGSGSPITAIAVI
ncbi:MAG: cyclase family protein [Thaumarchaeota archaeon]|nr:cyclase family protein [Nitrososphaerota archaeon]